MKRIPANKIAVVKLDIEGSLVPSTAGGFFILITKLSGKHP